MLWRSPHNEFEVESVQLADEHENDDDVYANPSSYACVWLPGKGNPGIRGELRDHSPHLVFVSHLISDADPVVFFVFQNLERFVAQPDAAEIAKEHVENPVVPPAF